ncbi:hypothetical protein [Chryseobacterium sp.]|uniref:hypothetical protein n=1 Tax=Chryseobacterium sp. TaxID=1871047 RepID=UPI0012A88604|nr:hypothetical protein [Chryseobacterium sp.]QFG52781.1 hypothetical protein F7R58_04215 [Chryseobacterium sp.]
MKRTLLSRKKISFTLPLIASVTILSLFSSCKEREEDPNETLSVAFTVQATPLVDINAVVTQVGTVQSTKFNVPGTTWSSEPQIVNSSVGAVHLAATGEGVDADSRLIVRIFVNGEQKAVDTAKGINLMAKTVVDFNK